MLAPESPRGLIYNPLAGPFSYFPKTVVYRGPRLERVVNGCLDVYSIRLGRVHLLEQRGEIGGAVGPNHQVDGRPASVLQGRTEGREAPALPPPRCRR